MRYIVLGAGAIGGVVGARLFQISREVILVARGDHLSAIRRDGLTLQSPIDSVTLPVPAVGHPSEVAFREREDVVLLATKTQDSARALDDLRGAAGPDVAVVCLQNGVESARIAARRFTRAVGAMVMLPTAHLEPGIVQAFSAPVPGIIDVGRYPNGDDPVVPSIAEDLQQAGFLSEARSDILRWQYGKLLDNLGNAVQALCGPEADCGELLRDLRSEAESCYRAAGIACAAGSEVRSRAGVLSLGKIDGRDRPGGSSWQSLARGAGSIETDYLNGEISLLGRMHGVTTPLNAALQRIANRCARERRPPASMSGEELRRMLLA